MASMGNWDTGVPLSFRCLDVTPFFEGGFLLGYVKSRAPPLRNSPPVKGCFKGGWVISPGWRALIPRSE